MKQRNDWSPGDWAVYRKSKRSVSPGPRASNIMAASKGDSYTYVVEKFWIVDRVRHVGSEHVGAKAEGRLVGHLDAVLQYGDGEGGR